jgi:hypothetical protein
MACCGRQTQTLRIVDPSPSEIPVVRNSDQNPNPDVNKVLQPGSPHVWSTNFFLTNRKLSLLFLSAFKKKKKNLCVLNQKKSSHLFAVYFFSPQKKCLLDAQVEAVTKALGARASVLSCLFLLSWSTL